MNITHVKNALYIAFATDLLVVYEQFIAQHLYQASLWAYTLIICGALQCYLESRLTVAFVHL